MVDIHLGQCGVIAVLHVVMDNVQKQEVAPTHTLLVQD